MDDDDMPPTRREALRLVSVAGTAAAAGCSGVLSGDTKLTVILLNFGSSRHFLDLEMLRADADERSDAVVLHDEFELPAPDEGAAAHEHREPDLLASEKYLVRAHLRGNESVRNRYTFYPDCDGGDESPEELYVEIHRYESDDEPYIRFQQNQCG